MKFQITINQRLDHKDLILRLITKVFQLLKCLNRQLKFILQSLEFKADQVCRKLRVERGTDLCKILTVNDSFGLFNIPHLKIKISHQVAEI